MLAPRTAVLLIDDDVRLATLLKEYLNKQDMELAHAEDGEHGLTALRRSRYDVVLLDLMMPGIDGLEVCRRIRADSELGQTAVLMLTAKGDDIDRIVGLELGADDYLPKPFNPRELLARIRAILRRGVAQATPRRRFRSGELEIDLEGRTVTCVGRPISLTHYEFQLLAVLARAAGRVLSRDQLLDALKGEEYDSFDRSIDVHISKLRSKIEPNPKEPRYIRTMRGVGYVLSRDEEV